MEGNFENCDLSICDNYNKSDENYSKFFALHQQEKIIETARMLNSFGSQFLYTLTPSVETHYNASDVHSTQFQSVVETIDTLLEWLERSGNDAMEDLKKKEAILRGILRLTGNIVKQFCFEFGSKYKLHG